MPIPIKSELELNKMRRAGQVLAQIFRVLEKAIKPGATGRDLEAIARRQIKKLGAEPAFLGFKDYPAVSCVSINSQLVHGLPSQQKFQPGDIVSVDIGVRFQGFCADKARTFGVGKINPQRQRLIRVTRQALRDGIKAARFGNRLGDISVAVQKRIEGAGFSVVYELAGHGIGRNIHEPPSVFNVGKPNTGPILQPGMCLAIEPMVSAGKAKVKTSADKWTVETADKSDCAHFEDTIAITKKGPLVLTELWQKEAGEVATKTPLDPVWEQIKGDKEKALNQFRGL